MRSEASPCSSPPSAATISPSCSATAGRQRTALSALITLSVMSCLG
jgi:hypothetical protein